MPNSIENNTNLPCMRILLDLELCWKILVNLGCALAVVIVALFSFSPPAHLFYGLCLVSCGMFFGNLHYSLLDYRHTREALATVVYNDSGATCPPSELSKSPAALVTYQNATPSAPIIMQGSK